MDDLGVRHPIIPRSQDDDEAFGPVGRAPKRRAKASLGGKNRGNRGKGM